MCKADKCSQTLFSHTQYRNCCATNNCPVLYKIVSCDETKKTVIFIKHHHDHEVKKRKNNLTGIDSFFKEEIKKLLNLGITEPKRIRTNLNNDFNNINGYCMLKFTGNKRIDKDAVQWEKL